MFESGCYATAATAAATADDLAAVSISVNFSIGTIVLEQLKISSNRIRRCPRRRRRRRRRRGTLNNLRPGQTGSLDDFLSSDLIERV